MNPERPSVHDLDELAIVLEGHAGIPSQTLLGVVLRALERFPEARKAVYRACVAKHPAVVDSKGER